MCYPRPLQEHVPVLVGGNGERHTLRLAARYADACNIIGEREVVARKVAALHRHCDAAERDRAAVAVTQLSTTLVGRDAADVAQLIDAGKPNRQSADRYAGRVNAGTVADQIGRFRRACRRRCQHGHRESSESRRGRRDRTVRRRGRRVRVSAGQRRVPTAFRASPLSSSRAWAVWIGAIALLAFVIRVLYVTLVAGHVMLGFDAVWYTLVSGEIAAPGTVSSSIPRNYFSTGRSVATATHAPLYPAVLAAVTRVVNAHHVTFRVSARQPARSRLFSPGSSGDGSAATQSA